MRIRTILSSAVAALVGIAVIGCGNTSPTGGNPSTPKNSDDKFTVKTPVLTTELKQGERKTVTITLDRGSAFQDSVQLSAEAPNGLKADFAKANIAASDPADVAMTVEANADAPIGEHIIKVTATPGKGKATAIDMKVKVEAKQ